MELDFMSICLDQRHDKRVSLNCITRQSNLTADYKLNKSVITPYNCSLQ